MKLVDDVWAALKKRIDESAATLVVLVLLGLLVGFKGKETLAGVVDEKLEPVLAKDKQQDQQIHFLAEDGHELGKDMREIYRVMPRVRDSDRLERPFPSHFDGGTP